MSVSGTCRDCGAPITWKVTGARRIPTNPSGDLHMCPTEVRQRRAKAIAQLQAQNSAKWVPAILKKYSLTQLEEVLNEAPVAEPLSVEPPPVDTDAAKWAEELAAYKAALSGEHLHSIVPLVVAVLKRGQRLIYLGGPAGTGKSWMAEQLSRLYAIVTGTSTHFVDVSFHGSSDSAELNGYNSITGTGFLPGKLTAPLLAALKAAGKSDKIFVCLDELDRAPAETTLEFNMAFAAGKMRLANGQLLDLSNVVWIATANSMGYPESDTYATVQQDGALLTRFACKFKVEYDNDFELAISADANFTRLVQGVRKTALELGYDLPCPVTPRMSIAGGNLIKDGMPRRIVEDIILWNALPTDVRGAIKTRLGIL